jgi:2-keto-4-pentenoate hydratase
MEAQLAERQRMLAAGEEHLGWKVGFGTPPVMEQLGTDAPLVGYLLRRAVVESGSALSLEGWAKPVLEPEIAVHLARDVEGGMGRNAIRDAVAGLGAAIELVDLDPPPSDVEAMLAGDLYQRAVLLGPPSEGLADVRAMVRRNGAVEAEADDATAVTGHPLDVVAHVAATLAAVGERVQAGSVVICGSVMPALAVAPGDDVTVDLDPLGTLSVRFT